MFRYPIVVMRNLQDRAKAEAPSHLQSEAEAAAVAVQVVATPQQPLSYKLDGQTRRRD